LTCEKKKKKKICSIMGRERSRSAWFWKDVGTGRGYGCWLVDGKDSAFAVCHFVAPTEGSLLVDPVCGHRLKIKGGAKGLAAHAESHGLSERDAEAFQRKEHQPMDHFVQKGGPPLSATQTANLNNQLVLALCSDGRTLSIFDKRYDAESDSERVVWKAASPAVLADGVSTDHCYTA
jgi:hypothetical protein